MTIVEVDNDRLDITLTGWDRVWTLKERISVPLSHVKTVEVEPRLLLARQNSGRQLLVLGDA
jgi:hypothetical protein